MEKSFEIVANAKHTPGPWNNTGKKGCIIKNGVDTIVCTIDGDETQGTDEANAKLIAVAPEMKQWIERELEWLIKSVHGAVGNGAVKLGVEQAIKSARALLAKAEGI